MKTENLKQPPEGCLLKFPATDGWSELYKKAESLEVEFASDGENINPCIILGADSEKVAFQLDDAAGINILIERLEAYKEILDGIKLAELKKSLYEQPDH